ncbi:hybrid sensor histidine kinase/response regulator [Methylobacterium terrae]|uniref:histidine kinase n=2 Tax=Methylobacterium terrae TaxID=2202827 RepID=A0A2U8WY02_9HYPH|nr:hybrid sensor histidine kinase/response regulator [Methylobacterium terrae]
MRAHDWSGSVLGRPEAWPACLRATVSLVLGSRFPMFVAFGPELGFLYNDAYAEILGDKHPAALGRRFRDIWSEIWPNIAPLVDRALSGEPTWSEDMPLLMNRRGYDERTWFTFSYSPLRDEEDRTVGMFCACTETTGRVQAETGLREAEARLRALTDHLPGGYVFQIATPREGGRTPVGGAERRFLTVSQGFERMTGVPAEAVLADPAAAYDLILPEHRGRIAEAEATAIRDLSPFDVEAPMRRPDGALVHTRIISAPRLADGQVIWDGLHLDDTARRQAEDRLRESEARLRLATEAAEVGLWDVDVVADTLFWPARVKAMFGISPDVPVSMADYYAGLHPDDREATSAAFAAALDPVRRALYDVEYRTVGKEDGVVRWVAAKGRGLFRGEACVRVVGTAIDITARRQAEAALRDSEARFRVLSQVLPNFVWATDAIGRATWFNERIYAYAGVAPGALDAAGWQGIVHPEDRERAAAQWRGAVAGGVSYQCEYRLRRADGAYRWFLARAQLVLSDDGAVARWVGTSTDIDDQKRVMAELVRFNETLEQRVAERTAERDRVWRNSRDLLAVVGADGVFRSVNPAWETILGHGPAEMEGRSFLDFIWPEDAAATQAALDGAASARDLTNFENRYRHRDGTPRWISWHSSAEGGLIFGYGRDVTAEKAQAAALAQAEEALRQSQKLEAVGQLTGGVAHDFNNLLTIIRSSVDFLRRPDLPEARRNRYLTAVSETVDRAAKLTSQLLAFARRQALKPETLDVGASLRVVADLLDTVTGARITVATDVPEHPCFVRVDASQFETALVNMAVNARDAMDGAGTLTLRLACGMTLPPIRGHAGAEGPFAAISLHDTGSGIAPDLLSRVFEPFFTTKEVGRGTGLGLSQVFGFAKQSGGNVAVESSPGRGTTFTLYLPEVEAEFAAAPEAEAAPVDPGGVGQRVLVVEDNLEVGRFATQILEDLGYAATWAVNAEDALDKLGPDGAGFDVVFSDVVMPGMGGIALARLLARRLPHLPVVLASGYSHVLAQENANGFELLHKPYSAEQVSRILRKVTRRRPAPA